MDEGFLFHNDWLDAIEEICETDIESGGFIVAMCEYAFEEKEPSFSGEKRALFLGMKPSLKCEQYDEEVEE